MPQSNVAFLDDYRENEPEAFEIPAPDGGVTIFFGNAPAGVNDPYTDQEADNDEDFFENLADYVDQSVLASLGSVLLDGIESDERARSQWIADRTEGIKLLALSIDKPRNDLGPGGETISTVRHPLLLEACIKFQSNFKREMLPANGPVKVKNDGQGTMAKDAQADKLGDLLNTYFTKYSPEYYPDTDRMSFDYGFSGTGFKKPYHCPLRRRPVSDTVEAKDLIVSNEASDLRTAQRVTHRQRLTRATMKRMVYVGAYRDVNLQLPMNEPLNSLEQAQKNVQGIQATTTRAEDQEYTVLECHTFLDLDGFEHVDEDDNETGLELPYVVTIEKHSRQILEIRRDWDPENNETFERRVAFVAYHFVPMFGFYASGLLHILGNATQAVTAAWRILLDNGMFANFPGFLYAKSGGRQTDLNFRVPPGGGAAVDLNGSEDIRKTIMGVPYKTDGSAPLMGLTDNIVTAGQRVGGTTMMLDPAGVSQNQPVGTTMAMVEQASQEIAAVHERAYVSQSQEFQQILRLMREDPESIWRLIKNDETWTYEELVETLNTYTLVPVADPNTPTHVHRIMKMTTLKQLQEASPELYDARAVDERILRAIKVDDPETLFAPPKPPQAMPPDPSVVIAEATKQTKMADIAAKKEIETGKMLLTANKQEADREKNAFDFKIRMRELDQKDRHEEDDNEITIEDIHTRARTADEDRRSRELIAGVQVAANVRTAEMKNETDKAKAAAKSKRPSSDGG